jgi:hypothetical protein
MTQWTMSASLGLNAVSFVGSKFLFFDFAIENYQNEISVAFGMAVLIKVWPLGDHWDTDLS